MKPLEILSAPHDRDTLERIARHLEEGGLLGYPTETVYGLGAAVTPDGVEALQALKGRSKEKPFLVLLPEADGEEAGWLDWSHQAQALARRNWPGPLTLVLDDQGERYPVGVRSVEGGVAVRLSSHPFVEALMQCWRMPLLSTSANRPGTAPARTATDVIRAVEGRPGVERLWIADGGPLPPSEPSTIVDCRGAIPTLIREGRLRFENLGGKGVP